MTLYSGAKCVRVPEETQVSVNSELELRVFNGISWQVVCCVYCKEIVMSFPATLPINPMFEARFSEARLDHHHTAALSSTVAFRWNFFSRCLL